jgi:hypothetical protein
LFCISPFSSFHVTYGLWPSFLQHNTNIQAPGGIRTHNPSKRAAADPRLRPRSHWDRQIRTHDPSKRSAADSHLIPHGQWDRLYCITNSVKYNS